MVFGRFTRWRFIKLERSPGVHYSLRSEESWDFIRFLKFSKNCSLKFIFLLVFAFFFRISCTFSSQHFLFPDKSRI